MDDYIAKGYAVKLSKDESASTSERTWYLSHHGVVNPKKAKVRVVYDADAEYGGTSLNKKLLQGPQLNNSLIGVLERPLTIEQSLKNAVCEVVSKNFYVDDCLFSVPIRERAIKVSLQLIQLLRKGNFRLTKFVSNGKEVLSAIPAEGRTVKSLDLDKLPIERALGLQWDTETDTFGVKRLSHQCSGVAEIGYGTVSYLRKQAEDGTLPSSWLRVVQPPFMYVSVPRIELQAATVPVCVHGLILKEIDVDISCSFFWTDSRITLQYINSDSCRFETYVANRVAEIRNVSQPNQCKHCPGALNTADDESRGLSARQLLSSQRWFSGPAFLSKAEEEWPQAEVGKLSEDNPEFKNEKPIFTLSDSHKLHELLVRYSSWTVLQRKIAWLLKFKAYLVHRNGSNSIAKYLTTEDLKLCGPALLARNRGQPKWSR
ncbi:uncharacterized protein LOC111323635 [Stylophora pistillata]|uniref:uncharacterized protein LOC111323635 n=1 Tax=Stylophora pistillata TaxID=50429 RepID=UPI000C044727|nr:uncharacterized protein LOC111323635 [Stylophora pistillata]